MMEIPSSTWTPGAAPPPLAAAAGEAPIAAAWRPLPGGIRHVFTHFELRLAVAAGSVGDAPAPAACRWAPIDTLGEEALPSVMRKVVRHALGHAGLP
jgi:A/G-specific adenine glycosylase